MKNDHLRTLKNCEGNGLTVRLDIWKPVGNGTQLHLKPPYKIPAKTI